jgi:hypothetical protein
MQPFFNDRVPTAPSLTGAFVFIAVLAVALATMV